MDQVQLFQAGNFVDGRAPAAAYQIGDHLEGGPGRVPVVIREAGRASCFPILAL